MPKRRRAGRSASGSLTTGHHEDGDRQHRHRHDGDQQDLRSRRPPPGGLVRNHRTVAGLSRFNRVAGANRRNRGGGLDRGGARNGEMPHGAICRTAAAAASDERGGTRFHFERDTSHGVKTIVRIGGCRSYQPLHFALRYQQVHVGGSAQGTLAGRRRPRVVAVITPDKADYVDIAAGSNLAWRVGDVRADARGTARSTPPDMAATETTRINGINRPARAKRFRSRRCLTPDQGRPSAAHTLRGPRRQVFTGSR